MSYMGIALVKADKISQVDAKLVTVLYFQRLELLIYQLLGLIVGRKALLNQSVKFIKHGFCWWHLHRLGLHHLMVHVPMEVLLHLWHILLLVLKLLILRIAQLLVVQRIVHVAFRV